MEMPNNAGAKPGVVKSLTMGVVLAIGAIVGSVVILAAISGVMLKTGMVG